METSKSEDALSRKAKSTASKTRTTVVDQIVASLCEAIFGGEYEVGQNLPPLRVLAQRHEVTLPTMQRVMGRMDELGMVKARQGSGVTVLEPSRHAAPAALVFWLNVLIRQDTREAVKFVESFVSVRRELSVGVMQTMRGGLNRAEGEAISEAIGRFERAAAQPGGLSLEEAFELDFELMRELLLIRPKMAELVILNMFEQLIGSSEAFLRAAYEHPERNVVGYRAMEAAFWDEELSDEEFGAQLRGMLRAFDMVSMAKFEALLER